MSPVGRSSWKAGLNMSVGTGQHWAEPRTPGREVSRSGSRTVSGPRPGHRAALSWSDNLQQNHGGFQGSLGHRSPRESPSGRVTSW